MPWIAPRHLMILLAASALAACTPRPVPPLSAVERLQKQQQPPEQQLPDHWQSEATQATVSDGWLKTFADPQLSVLVDKAQQHNRGVAQVRAQVAQARQQVLIAGADELPELNLAATAGRSDSGSRVSDNASLNLNLSWNVDVWGRLDDQAREAALTLAAQQATLADRQLQLSADVARGWYSLQQAQQLLALYQQRRANLQQNLELIQARYQQGLSSALDIYLARNNVHSEDARISAQQQTVLSARRTLEQLLGDYPAGLLRAEMKMPLLDSAIPAGLPADLIRRRPDLQSRWLQLMSADAALAAAHKNRFPSLNLTASLGRSSSELSDLLSGGSLAWSLGSSLAQTLLDGGRKEASEALQLARRNQLEQQYLEALYQAFEQVENLLSNHQALQQQYQAYLEARSNADAAETLAFEQYQKGLANYTTVLESQRQAFDARTSVINLRGQLLQNRISLHQALAGHWRIEAENA
ncbi:MAG: efflux transporter outer membrane subunit [Marinobacterium sp.]|nr:efflux transporter outer membrane subunit [Marinobacterium sp.]